MAGPLDDITVVDLTRVLAGPYCTMVLSDLGARVIKVESPVGDDARAFPPFNGDRSAYFESLNRGKESLVLDIKDPDDQALLARLLEQADVVLSIMRPDRAPFIRGVGEVRDHQRVADVIGDRLEAFEAVHGHCSLPVSL